ncbi:MAG TPA: DNA phosphorothioation-associated protein 4 [Candidatus Paceibacterota bacterium]|nr:DNA phosphorothioation-associated protein 4 [Verrucomicrobiota bacterium]HRY51568.1 DNA phosphorothioation-associated protein 4 [Candidatus Paceibacterota bacterium]
MRRIQRAIDKEPIVKSLTDGEYPCFREIFRLLIFAAILGLKLKRREPLEKVDSGKSVPETYFANSPVWPGLIYLIGIVETTSTGVLQANDQAEDTLATVFEEYANGGLAFLKERFDEAQVDIVSLIDIINELTVTVPARNPNLADIAII